ncbi:MAG: hypothetical protein GTO02_05190 [Candidatus Dadabacteria bacterium]|nr:hypothetical protein [Candidatus Dadabacteria bacterium]
MRKIIIILGSTFILCVLLNSNSHSKMITLFTCLQTEVQTAIDSAKDGDAVIIPAGRCTWSVPVKIPTTKGIILRGNGIDSTTIIDSTGSNNNALEITMTTGNSIMRLTGITFDAAGSSKWGPIQIDGKGTNFRIDHIKINNLSTRGITISATTGNLFGVIDNVEFNAEQNVSAQGVSILGTGAASWMEPPKFGSADYVFVEDCTFNFAYPNDGALDAYDGARYVFRYNAIIGTFMGHHGNDSGGYRSAHTFEIYNNVFSASSNIARGMFFRGGTGVVYNNTFNFSYNTPIEVTNYRSCCGAGLLCTPNNATERCDGDHPDDGNEDLSGYPCEDQIGRTTDGNDIGTTQDLLPLYEWNNRIDLVDVNIQVHSVCENPSISDHIKENRDFYNDKQSPGYKPFIYPHTLRTNVRPNSPTNPRIIN